MQASCSTKTLFDGGPTYPLRHRLLRLCWNIVWLLACAWTPRQFGGWRRLVLRAFGARMEKGANVHGSARIWLPSNLVMMERSIIGGRAEIYNTATVTLMRQALVSQGAHLCAGTHDYSHPDFPLVTKPITIGRNAWICSKAIVGPGVTVGDNSVLGAGAVAFGDLLENGIYAGNPAVRIKDRWPNAGLGHGGGRRRAEAQSADG
ncbi:putative colanic acid biosynthesis acetyltransferase [Neorhizobium sp. SOG26]|nr:putative colanic acid biosynthesis acetyltransferase [Neorhizobium sp. SOG26]